MKLGLVVFGLIFIVAFIYFCYLVATMVVLVLPVLKGFEFILTVLIIMLLGGTVTGKGE